MKTILGWWQVVAKHGREWSGWAGLGWAGLGWSTAASSFMSPLLLSLCAGWGGVGDRSLHWFGLLSVILYFVYKIFVEMQNNKKFKSTDHFIIYNPGLLTFEWHFYDKKFWITFRGSLETLGAGAGAGRGPEERCCLARGSRSRAGSGGAGDAAGTAAAARTRVLPRSALRLCRALQRPQWFYPCHTIEVDEWNITSKINVNNKHLKKEKWDDTKK